MKCFISFVTRLAVFVLALALLTSPALAAGQTIIIDGVVNHSVYGNGTPPHGSEYAGDPNNNTVIVTNTGAVLDFNSVIGSLGNTQDVTNNKVFIYGLVEGEVIGGHSFNYDAKGNSVLISGGTIGTAEEAGEGCGNVLGGVSYNGNATGNKVTINGGTIFSDVCGGLALASGNATHNTVTISGAPDLSASRIWGGWSGGGNSFTGNTLNVFRYSGSLVLVQEFEYINFFLSNPLPEGALLNIINNEWLVELEDVKIDILGIDAGNALEVGQKITLISKAQGFGDPVESWSPTCGGTWRLGLEGGALVATLVGDVDSVVYWNITGVPTTATVGVALTLSGTVTPAGKTIASWEIVDAGTTGATITGSTLSTKATGAVKVRANVDVDEKFTYTQDFEIKVVEADEHTPGGGGGCGNTGVGTLAALALVFGLRQRKK